MISSSSPRLVMLSLLGLLTWFMISTCRVSSHAEEPHRPEVGSKFTERANPEAAKGTEVDTKSLEAKKLSLKSDDAFIRGLYDVALEELSECIKTLESHNGISSDAKLKAILFNEREKYRLYAYIAQLDAGKKEIAKVALNAIKNGNLSYYRMR